MRDTSETYIKQCSCPKIQDRWEPKIGDWYYNKSHNKIRCLRYEFDVLVMTPEHYPERITHVKKNIVWLLRQDELRAMLKSADWSLSMEGKGVFSYVGSREGSRAIYANTPEQALIQGVMHELHCKQWIEGGWIEKE